MSCWDCLKNLIPTQPKYTKPTYPLEEIVIMKNNKSSEKIDLKDWNYLEENQSPRNKTLIKESEILEKLDYITTTSQSDTDYSEEKQNLIIKEKAKEKEKENMNDNKKKMFINTLEEDKDEIIYERENYIENIQWEALSDTEIFGNQKLKKRMRKKKFSNVKNYDNEYYSSDDSWDSSLIN